MKRLLAVLSFCLVAASCQEGHTVVSNPIVPNPPILETPPKPPIYPPESWTLTASVTSVTPHPCWRDLTGLTSDWALIVRRAEAMRLFVYWDPTDGIEYCRLAFRARLFSCWRLQPRELVLPRLRERWDRSRSS